VLTAPARGGGPGGVRGAAPGGAPTGQGPITSPTAPPVIATPPPAGAPGAPAAQGPPAGGGGGRGGPGAAAAAHTPAYWIKLTALPDGTMTVTNSRNGFTKTYGKGSGGKAQGSSRRTQ
jgi:hypothetical protein